MKTAIKHWPDLNRVLRPALLTAALSFPYSSHAGPVSNDSDFYLQAGTYTHYSSSDEHKGPNVLVSLEAKKTNDWLYGLALFDNSFGQFSQYLYAGKQWQLHGAFEHFHTKLTAGLIHGYRGEYKDKIPLNNLGTAPAIIPSIGYDYGEYGADIIMLGNSGLLFTVGKHF
jgi:hypothetical protein